ncbi:tRNA threonylcarbamoyladenosine biosynthesis protein TsaE [Fontimonas thermophila]|uniref:tRNA threonylcarbamoyladenosine biosynthesis protein TsaE n=1 Tax=Fontimonas thermophila TaxID=1076937 RepID=A0A1I2HLU4_9GAMM|nr:tRNA (adenosine(37)-N6)-threonylcarbamoyltransferase complex ATPase subunit type 1 TsaE [Fontimonas thermophila]SFF30652.1 tRNA threonylcarbamoyladenosine biosynthesis protein TsaE [Fontimonas thermophila]
MNDLIRLLDAAHTEAVGRALAHILEDRPGAVIYLEGELGAGKTTLARGFLRALGVTEPVRSPTYTLLEPYAIGMRSVLHMDLYRLRDPAELWELSLDSYPPERTVWLVEWPQRAGDSLPTPTLRLQLAHDGAHRVLRIGGESALVCALYRTLQDLN